MNNIEIISTAIADYLLISRKDAISNVLRETGVWDQHILSLAKMF